MVIALVLDALIGYADYITGYDVSVNLFYLIPLLLVAWFVGRKEGLVMSGVCIVTAALASSLSGEYNYHSLRIILWNLFLTEGFFLVVIFLSFQIKSGIREREELIHELQNALANVKTLSGLLPICAACKKIRDDEGYWTQVETYISKHTDADFTHGLCPECVKKLYPEHYENIFGKREKADG